MEWVGNLRRVANPPAEAAKWAVNRRLATGAVAVGTTVAHQDRTRVPVSIVGVLVSIAGSQISEYRNLS
jgi:hypothetical protein